mgnify:CR=1 FL=1
MTGLFTGVLSLLEELVRLQQQQLLAGLPGRCAVGAMQEQMSRVRDEHEASPLLAAAVPGDQQLARVAAREGRLVRRQLVDRRERRRDRTRRSQAQSRRSKW